MDLAAGSDTVDGAVLDGLARSLGDGDEGWVFVRELIEERARQSLAAEAEAGDTA
jgi:hypothetical protein